jgi:hypothetical protein
MKKKYKKSQVKKLSIKDVSRMIDICRMKGLDMTIPEKHLDESLERLRLQSIAGKRSGTLQGEDLR